MRRTVTVKRIACICERCQYEWLTDTAPARCPKCKSPYWDRPRKDASSTGKRRSK